MSHWRRKCDRRASYGMASERGSVRGYDTLTEGSTLVVLEGAEKETQLLQQLEELNK